jgi:hypothetical protein
MKHPPHAPEYSPDDPAWRLRQTLALAAIADRHHRAARRARRRTWLASLRSRVARLLRRIHP